MPAFQVKNCFFFSNIFIRKPIASQHNIKNLEKVSYSFCNVWTTCSSYVTKRVANMKFLYSSKCRNFMIQKTHQWSICAAQHLFNLQLNSLCNCFKRWEETPNNRNLMNTKRLCWTVVCCMLSPFLVITLIEAKYLCD